MLNEVTKKECKDALEYFWQVEDLENERDRTYYLKILMKKVANDYGIKLEGI